MGMFQKIVLGGATVAAMSTGQVQAAENSAPMENPDATKTETVVTPKDTVINSDNVLDLSNEFLTSQFTSSAQEVSTPGTIEDLKETLSSPTNLTDDQQKHIDLWSDYIISNPQDPVSREAFVAIKEATDEVANKWIKIDQYYQSVETAGSYDDLKYSKENLIKNMDAMLEKSQVRENIPEANVEYRRGSPAKDYATLRLYNQLSKLDYIMNKNPSIIKEQIGLLNSKDKKSKEQAYLNAAEFYKTYGMDLNKCCRDYILKQRGGLAQGEPVDVMIRREKDLLNDKYFKEDAYKYCLHNQLDMAFSQTESTIHNINVVYVNDKYSTIDGNVSLALDDYAKLVAKNARGDKLTRGQENRLNFCPPDIRESLQAYYSACSVKFTQEMNKPKGEYKDIRYCNTNSIRDEKATLYIRLLRLGENYTKSGQNEMSAEQRGQIEEIEKERPDLKRAKEEYDRNLDLQKENFANAMNRPAGENVTVYDRYGFTENASSNYFNNKGLSYAPVDHVATRYVNLLRLGADHTISGQNQMTDNDKKTIQEIEMARPDLAIARKAYEAERNQQTQQKTLQLSASDFMTR